MAVPEARSLMQHVEETQSECLNEDEDHCLAKFLSSRKASDASSSTQLLMSDDGDPQLLISLGFSVPMRLCGLFIGSADGCVADQTAPKKLRIFINKPNMSFSDAESDRATDELVLPEDASIEKGVLLPLKQARYQNVASLQIFVVENGGGSVTKIGKLDVFGFPADNLQMKDWRRLKPEEMLAPNDT